MTRIAFLLFPGLTQLDLTGPAQILSRMPGAKADLVWETLDPVMSDAGFALVPTTTFADLPNPDILCVPGGIGVQTVMENPAAMAWIRAAGESAQWVTSVCTGSLILGAAGLLKGYKATTHWAWHDGLSRFGAVPVKARTVIDRNRVTGGGVTAGIDFALTLAAQIHGETVAKMLQLSFEYDPAPPFDSGSPEKAGAALMQAYQERVALIAPNRAAEFDKVATALGYPA
jgi:cyclohexyl-isocyanide hydratase